MFIRKLLFLSPVLLTLAGCVTQKKPQAAVQVINIPFTPDAPAETDTKEHHPPYSPAYTRINALQHTALDLKFNYDSAFVYGKATLTLKPYFYDTDSLTLDAKSFEINNLYILTNAGGTVPLQYGYDGEKLQIKLDKSYNRNEKYTLFIDYTAMPNKRKAGGSSAITSDKGLYFINNTGQNDSIPKQIWSQGEPQANSCWFPTIDDPQQKHSQEITLTVEDKYQTLSNGRLIQSVKNTDGTRTDTWKQDQIHSTYLTMIAVGEYALVKDKWRDKEVNYYVEPDYEQYAKMIFGNTPEMMEFYSNKTGVDYPWDKYSQIVVRDFVSGAMENTTATVLFDKLQMNERQYLDETYEDIIAHELFHHWFGDYVTCESWPNLPLNESFATYGEYLWYEYKYGRAEADLKGQIDALAYLSSTKDYKKDLIRFHINNPDDMFDLVSYQKGGRVLHMLRKYLGDDAFFAGINAYLNEYKYSSTEIHGLRMAFEKTVGQDLNWFFNQWFLSSGQPTLNIQSYYLPDQKQVELNVSQTQDLHEMPLFRLPVDVDIYCGGEVKRKRITVNQQNQTFYFDVQAKPNAVNFDAEHMLLALKEENKSYQEWLFLLKNGPLVMDKIRALIKLYMYGGYENVQQEIKTALTNESWGVRAIALSNVTEFNQRGKEAFYPIVTNMALNDPKSYVRATALSILMETYSEKNITETFKQALNDPSPMVEDIAQQYFGMK